MKNAFRLFLVTIGVLFSHSTLNLAFAAQVREGMYPETSTRKIAVQIKRAVGRGVLSVGNDRLEAKLLTSRTIGSLDCYYGQGVAVARFYPETKSYAIGKDACVLIEKNGYVSGQHQGKDSRWVFLINSDGTLFQQTGAPVSAYLIRSDDI